MTVREWFRGDRAAQFQTAPDRVFAYYDVALRLERREPLTAIVRLDRYSYLIHATYNLPGCLRIVEQKIDHDRRRAMFARDLAV